jgi:predicted DsbA family dithiol-disulfide isomerase
VTGSSKGGGAAIEVFADVRCPFAHVGLRRLFERRAAAGRTDVTIWIRAWPLELVNDEPLDPELIAEEADELRAQVAPDLFTDVQRSSFPETSMPALVLAAAAYEHGTAVGERVSRALRDALFEGGRDIASPDVLLDIAGDAGIDLPASDARERVVRDWHEGRDRDVVGSPHFFVGESSFFCPSLKITRVDGHLRIVSDPAVFDAFLEDCFREVER